MIRIPMSDRRPSRRPRAPALPLVAFPLTALLLAGCSGPSQDVRITLCQGLVAERLQVSPDPVWEGHDEVMKGYQDLEVRIRFTPPAGGAPGEAVCYYPYEAEYGEARTLAEPLTAYDSHPARMRFNGEEVATAELAVMVNAVMVKQGREGLEKLRERVKPSP